MSPSVIEEMVSFFFLFKARLCNCKSPRIELGSIEQETRASISLNDLVDHKWVLIEMLTERTMNFTQALESQ